ncbi:HD domain-containing protein [uncultured Shewanella sp.]|uniref:HD domain-containing protein n=1 Tax=uncultured Shewanella sp. TaxID=173975 RepID=UPI0026026E9C|nr:HD domain-containing protein [uncultured Shewanella sp.]
MNKIITDPVHGNLILDLKDRHDLFLSKIIESSLFQRLRYIKQQGAMDFIFPGSTHSRYLHSIGVLHISKLFHRYTDLLNDQEDYKLLTTIGLIHDLGHGPFSHVTELIQHNLLGTYICHEEWLLRILKENSEIRKIIVDEYGEYFLEKIMFVINDNGNNKIKLLYSSQVDIDRLDYLLRDNYYSGIKNGTFDIIAIINNMRFFKKNKKIMIYFKEDNVYDLVEFFYARFSNYSNITGSYKAVSIRGMFIIFFKNIIKEQKDNSYLPSKYFCMLINGNTISLEEYLMTNDSSVMNFLMNFSGKELESIAKDIINTNLYPCFEIKGLTENLNLLLDEYMVGNNMMATYKRDFIGYDSKKSEIYIKSSSNEMIELSQYSQHMKILSELQNKIYVVIKPSNVNEVLYELKNKGFNLIKRL